MIMDYFTFIKWEMVSNTDCQRLSGVWLPWFSYSMTGLQEQRLHKNAIFFSHCNKIFILLYNWLFNKCIQIDSDYFFNLIKSVKKS